MPFPLVLYRRNLNCDRIQDYIFYFTPFRAALKANQTKLLWLVIVVETVALVSVLATSAGTTPIPTQAPCTTPAPNYTTPVRPA